MDIDPIALSRVRIRAKNGEAKAIRERALLSLSDIGKAIGRDQSAVYRWEEGLRAPRGEAAIKYGELLDALAKL